MNKTLNKKIALIFVVILFSIGFLNVLNIAHAQAPTDAELISYIQSRIPGFDPSGIDRANLLGTARTELDRQGFNDEEIAGMLNGFPPLPSGSGGGGTFGGGGTSGSFDPEFVPISGGGYGIPGVIDKDTAKNPSLFFNAVFNFTIVIAAFLAVVMIAIGGIQYMSTDAVSGKSEGRERITYALLGLLLILFSYILLKQINPDILNLGKGTLFK